MRLKSLWIAVGLSVASYGMPVGNAAFAQEPAKKVEDLSKDATKKYREKDFAAAIELFQKAYDIEPVPNLLFNIAKCYEKLEQWDPAIEYYQKFVVEPDVDKAARQSALDRIDALKEVQAAQRLAEADKKQPDDQTVVKKEEPKVEPSAPDHTWAYVTLGTGVAFLAGGAVFGVLASSEQTNFEQGATYQDRVDAKDAGETYAVVADGLYITGAVLAVVGVVLYVTAHAEQDAVASGPVKPVGWVGHGGGGLGLVTSF